MGVAVAVCGYLGMRIIEPLIEYMFVRSKGEVFSMYGVGGYMMFTAWDYVCFRILGLESVLTVKTKWVIDIIPYRFLLCLGPMI